LYFWHNNYQGNVGIGFGASSMVSQWTWAATLQQSCTVAYKYGISGGFWYYYYYCLFLFLLFVLLSCIDHDCNY
jgi:Na+/proline symporter